MIRLFKEKNIKEALDPVRKKAVQKIELIPEHRIMNENLDKIAEEISAQLKIDSLKVDFSNKTVDVKMVDIPGSQFPPGTDVRPHQSYPCARVYYTFKIKSGDVELLTVSPTKRTFQKSVDITTDRWDEFTIFYQTQYATIEWSDQLKEEVKKEIRSIVNEMEPMIEALNNDIKEFNKILPSQILEVLTKKREDIQKKKDQNDDLTEF